jgi:spoIIIJ-associated protein
LTEPHEIKDRTLEGAYREAERRFGAPRDQLDIRVLSRGTKGVFGIGAEAACIVVTVPRASDEPPSSRRVEPETEWAGEGHSSRPEEISSKRSQPDASSHSGPAAKSPRVHDSAELDAIAEAATRIMEELLRGLGFVGTSISVRSQSPLVIDVRGDGLGLLIGRRGDNLAALQFMLNSILAKEFHTWPRAVIDIEEYRSRREDSLVSLGKRVADRVSRNSRPFTLEAMPAGDRRIIHIALKDRQDIETYSVGEGPGRRVVIAPRGGQ